MVLSCTTLNDAGTVSAAASATATIFPPPTDFIPITAPASAASGKVYIAWVNAKSNAIYLWTVDGATTAITSVGGGAGQLSADGSTNLIQFNAGALGTRVITCIETNMAGDSAAHAGTASVTVVPPAVAPMIDLSQRAHVTDGVDGKGGVTAGTTYDAIATIHAPVTGNIYSWTIAGGVIPNGSGSCLDPAGCTSATSTAGTQGTTAIQYNPNDVPYTQGTAGVLITCIETTTSGDSATGTASVNAYPRPLAPDLSAFKAAHPNTGPSPTTAVTAGKMYTPTITAHQNMTYVWTLDRGTFSNSSSSTAGVASSSTNSATFTAAADNKPDNTPDALTLTVVESNAINDSATISLPMADYPTPVSTTVVINGKAANGNAVTAGRTYTTSTTVRSHFFYTFTIVGGTLPDYSASTTGKLASGVTGTSTGTLTINFVPTAVADGSTGTVTIAVKEENEIADFASGSSGTTSHPAPGALTIALAGTIPGKMTSGKAYSGSVGTRSGFHYFWSVDDNGGLSPTTLCGAVSASACSSGSGTFPAPNTVTITAGDANSDNSEKAMHLVVAEINAIDDFGNTAIPVQVRGAPQTPLYSTGLPSKITAGTSYSMVVSTVLNQTISCTVTNATFTENGTSSTSGLTSMHVTPNAVSPGFSASMVANCIWDNGLDDSKNANNSAIAYTAPVAPAFTLTPPAVMTSSKTYLLSVASRNGIGATDPLVYSWAKVDGTSTSGGFDTTAGTSVTFTPTNSDLTGTDHIVTVTVTETNGAGDRLTTTVTPDIFPAPAATTVTAPSKVTQSISGAQTFNRVYSASVPTHPGMHYVWTVTNSTITSAGGTAGVTGGGNNSITFTATNATAGDGTDTMTLACAELNGIDDGTASPSSPTSIFVYPAPFIEPITMNNNPQSTLTAGANYSASVPARPRMHYFWTLSNGSGFSSVNGTSNLTGPFNPVCNGGACNYVSFTAGNTGAPLVLTAQESNEIASTAEPTGANTIDSNVPSVASATLVAPPTANLTGASLLFWRGTTSLEPTFSPAAGGTSAPSITSNPSTPGFPTTATSGTGIPIGPLMAASSTNYTLTVFNAAGTSRSFTYTITSTLDGLLALGAQHGCEVDASGAATCWGQNENGELGDGTSTPHAAAAPISGPALPASWTTVAAGSQHTCAVGSDGSLWCWGINSSGQLGQGGITPSFSMTPLKVGTATNWTIATSSSQTTCALRSDQSLWCWGSNGSGQTGVPNTTNPVTSPTPVAGSWSRVSVGAQHVCATRANDSSLFCWGDNGAGQLGIDSGTGTCVPGPGCTATTSTPTQVTLGGLASPVISVSAGYATTCAIRAGDDTRWCWGSDNSGQFGLGFAAFTTADPTHIYRAPQQVGTASWQHIALGREFSCGAEMDVAKTFACAGRNQDGELANGNYDPIGSFAHPDLGSVSSLTGGLASPDLVVANERQACAARAGATPTVMCWGANDMGQLGIGLFGQKNRPMRVSSATNWAQWVGSNTNACALRKDGTVWCAGDNTNGVNGLGDTTTHPILTQVGTHTDWASLASGGNSVLAVKLTNAVWSWGSDANGVLGDGVVNLTLVDQHAPENSGNSFAQVSIGAAGCGITATGNLFCWGDNSRGEVGNGSATAFFPTPQSVTTVAPATDTGWTMVSTSPSGSSGSGYTCGINGGALFCWGENQFGQLGQGGMTPAFSTTPLRVGTTTDWTMISAGDDSACGLRTTNEVFCWGYNGYGVVPAIAATPVTSPALVASGYLTVSAGGGHACGVTTAGTVFCWGLNTSGEIGDGTFNGTRGVTQEANSFTDWQSVTAVNRDTCGIRKTAVGGAFEQSLWCWGANLVDRHGDGSLHKTTPIALGPVTLPPRCRRQPEGPTPGGSREQPPGASLAFSSPELRADQRRASVRGHAASCLSPRTGASRNRSFAAAGRARRGQSCAPDRRQVRCAAGRDGGARRGRPHPEDRAGGRAAGGGRESH
ncbi:MAG: hypothetical protein E6J78_17410 [Deltaproteobacteria bacterium]|nr:MAG: hypothetical protein E6J78_17410 [Deltaproteobacteria bacterium]